MDEAPRGKGSHQNARQNVRYCIEVIVAVVVFSVILVLFYVVLVLFGVILVLFSSLFMSRFLPLSRFHLIFPHFPYLSPCLSHH